MKALTQAVISWGPFGVLLLAILDSAGIPLPGGVDALLIAVTALEPTQAFMSAVLAIIGSTAGSLILYYIARAGGHKYLARHTTSGRGQRMREWYTEYGLLTVFVPALVPIPLPMKVFVICAGALEMSVISFTLVVLAARIPRYFALAYLGAELGTGAIAYLRANALPLAALAVLLFLLLFVVVKIWHRPRRTA